MRNYDEYFEGYAVPEWIKARAIAIMRRFNIYGVCDGMYICNVIAHKLNLGDGKGEFSSDCMYVDEECIHQAIEALAGAYGCNIRQDEKNILAHIVLDGVLDKAEAIDGLKSYIWRCKIEILKADEWRKEYLQRCIEEAEITITELYRELGKAGGYLAQELEDDNTPTGGVGFLGETLADFIEEANLSPDISVSEVNKVLSECGIRPIKEVSA